MRSLLAVTAAALALLAVPMTASAMLGELSIVSRADGPAGALGDQFSNAYPKAVSADGRFVVFISNADNFGGPFVAERNAYRRDLALGRTELVSRASGVAGAIGDDSTFNVTVSSDGNRVAFASAADNLSASDDNNYNNVFVRDMNASTTTLVSRASGVAGAAANNTSFMPVISGDGNFVIFQSTANNLDPTFADGNGEQDVFVRDLTTFTTRLLSKSTGNAASGDTSYASDISQDGRYVIFATDATNLGGTISAGTSNVYLRDRTAATTTLISQPSGTSDVSGNASSGPGSITSDGQKIVFASRSTNLATDATNGVDQIYLRDRSTNTTSLISRSPAGAIGDAESNDTTISPDGSLVTFLSLADNLDVPGGSYRQAFVRLMDSGRTQLVSRAGTDGAPGDFDDMEDLTSGWSNRQVIFSSHSKNLIPGVTSGIGEIYTRDVRVPDPVPPAATIKAKKFVAKLSKRKFKVKVTTSGGATLITGSATISVSKKIVKSGKLKVKLKARTVSAGSSTHTLTFTLSKTQNKRVLKALKTKKSRVKVSLSLTATAPGGPGSAKISGKLKR